MRDVYANEEAIPSFFSIVSFAAVALQGATGHRLTSSTADPVRRRAPKKNPGKQKTIGGGQSLNKKKRGHLFFRTLVGGSKLSETRQKLRRTSGQPSTNENKKPRPRSFTFNSSRIVDSMSFTGLYRVLSDLTAC